MKTGLVGPISPNRDSTCFWKTSIRIAMPHPMPNASAKNHRTMRLVESSRLKPVGASPPVSRRYCAGRLSDPSESRRVRDAALLDLIVVLIIPTSSSNVFLERESPWGHVAHNGRDLAPSAARQLGHLLEGASHPGLSASLGKRRGHAVPYVPRPHASQVKPGAVGAREGILASCGY